MTALDTHHELIANPCGEANAAPIPRLKEFQVQWSATVRAESAKSAVRRLWASHFKLSSHDLFSVYCGQTKKSYQYRANGLAPELNKGASGGHVYRVTWKAPVLASNEKEAMQLVKDRLVNFRPEKTPRISIRIHDRRGSCLKSERVGLHDILHVVK